MPVSVVYIDALAGIRQEQDLYVRLIDSVTKQVSDATTCLWAVFVFSERALITQVVAADL